MVNDTAEIPKLKMKVRFFCPGCREQIDNDTVKKSINDLGGNGLVECENCKVRSAIDYQRFIRDMLLVG